MFAHLSLTAAALLLLVSGASAADCGANVEGDYNNVKVHCQVVRRDSSAAFVDGMFSLLQAQVSRNAGQGYGYAGQGYGYGGQGYGYGGPRYGYGGQGYGYGGPRYGYGYGGPRYVYSGPRY